MGKFKGFFIIKQIKSLDCALFCCKALGKRLSSTQEVGKHSTTRLMFPTTLVFFGTLAASCVCLTTEQSTVKASLPVIIINILFSPLQLSSILLELTIHVYDLDNVNF